MDYFVMEEDKNFGPYKATKLWNEMIDSFRNGIPLKRHRRHIKVYEKCFTGQEAINWLQDVLRNNPCVVKNISKDQTIQLLNKFLKAGVLQNVNCASEVQEYIKERDLYKLTEVSSPRLPLGKISPNIPLKSKEQGTSKPEYFDYCKAVILQEHNLKRHMSSGEFSTVAHKFIEVKKDVHSAKKSLCDIKSCEQNKKNCVHKIASNTVHKQNETGTLMNPSQNFKKHFRNLTDSCPKEMRDLTAHYKTDFAASHEHELGFIRRRYTGSRLNKNSCLFIDTLTPHNPDPVNLNVQRKVNLYKTNNEYSDAHSVKRKPQVFHENERVSQSMQKSNTIEEIFHLNSSKKVGHKGMSNEIPVCYETASTSPLKYDTNVDYSSLTMNNRNKCTVSGRLGFPNFEMHKEVAHVSSQNIQVEHVWKQIIISRLEILLPNLIMFFKLELENVPGEWVSSNAMATLNDHDDHFPKSLVAAMNSLVERPQAVPNEILMAFKEHFFKIKEPLTTFKMYSLLSKVYLHIMCSNTLSNSKGILTLKLPSNLCFETEFSSDSPVTHIVPQRSVDILHFSKNDKFSECKLQKIISKNTDLSEQLTDSPQVNEKMGNQFGLKYQKTGKFTIGLNKMICRQMRVGFEQDKMFHIRNKSGGYVNPALSKSLDDTEFTPSLPDEEFDYAAALKTLNILMRCSHRNTSSTEADRNKSDKNSSDSFSYYTAASSSSALRRLRGSSFDHMESVDTNGEETKEMILASVIQLLLLCIPVYNRFQLHQLLKFMNQWMVHYPLCGDTDVVTIFTPTILCSELESDYDASLATHIVHFLVKHHELLMKIPRDLENTVHQQFSFLQSQMAKSAKRVTYCEQVSCEQFEQQKLTDSQHALSDLLEQILQDTKMPPKEKRKHLKMFKESYPHIYQHHFPDSATLKKPGRLANFSVHLKNLRI